MLPQAYLDSNKSGLGDSQRSPPWVETAWLVWVKSQNGVAGADETTCDRVMLGQGRWSLKTGGHP